MPYVFEDEVTEQPGRYVFEDSLPSSNRYVFEDEEPSEGIISKGLNTVKTVAKNTLPLLGKGFISLPETAAGLYDISQIPQNILGKGLDTVARKVMPETMANVPEYQAPSMGKLLEPVLAEPKRYYEEALTPEYKAGREEISQAEGFMGTTKAIVQNPAIAAGTIIESLPASLIPSGIGGRVAASGLLTSAMKKSGIEAGTQAAKDFAINFFKNPKVISKLTAIGGAIEGLTITGLQQESLRQEGLDPIEAAKYSIPAGIISALIPVLVSKIPGLSELDAEALLSKAGNAGKRATLLESGKKIAAVTFKEGFLEEMPQEIQETIWENLALNKPWNEGLAQSGVLGAVAGMGQGGGMALGAAGIDYATSENKPIDILKPVKPEHTLEEIRQLDIMNRVEAKQRELNRDLTPDEFQAIFNADPDETPINGPVDILKPKPDIVGPRPGTFGYKEPGDLSTQPLGLNTGAPRSAEESAFNKTETQEEEGQRILTNLRPNITEDMGRYYALQDPYLVDLANRMFSGEEFDLKDMDKADLRQLSLLVGQDFISAQKGETPIPLRQSRGLATIQPSLPEIKPIIEPQIALPPPPTDIGPEGPGQFAPTRRGPVAQGTGPVIQAGELSKGDNPGDYTGLELRQIAKDRGYEIPPSMIKKTDMIEFIKANKPAPAPPVKKVSEVKVSNYPQEAFNFRDWVNRTGGINLDDKTHKGTFEDMRWDRNPSGRKVPRTGFPKGIFRNGGRGMDERTLQAIEDGWLPEGSTEDDFIQMLEDNPSYKDKWSRAGQGIIDVDIEAEGEYYRQQLEDIENGEYTEDEARADERAIQEAFRAQISEDQEFTVTDEDLERIFGPTKSEIDNVARETPIKVQRSSDEAGVNTQYEVLDGSGRSLSRAAIALEPEKYSVDETLMPTVEAQKNVDVNAAMAKELEKAQAKKVIDKQKWLNLTEKEFDKLPMNVRNDMNTKYGLPTEIKTKRANAEREAYERDVAIRNKDLASPKTEAKAVQPTELTKSGGKTKEPWEMNEDELASQDNDWYKNKQHQIPLDKFVTIGGNRNYIKIDGEYYNILANGEIGSKVEPDLIKNQKDEAAKSHRYFVEKALKEGKPVPTEVLKDYPDLKPQDIVVEGKGEEKDVGKITISDTVYGKSSYGASIYKDNKLIAEGSFSIDAEGNAKVGMIRGIKGRDTIPINEWREIIKQIKNRYPQIKKIVGDRVTRQQRQTIPKPAEEKPAGEKNLTIESYSEKAIVVRGNTKPYKDELLKLGGRFNPKLQGGVGWIFPKTKESQVKDFIGSTETKAIETTSETPKKSFMKSEKDIAKQNADKLRAVAEKAKKAGEEKYNQDRNTNTSRRARMAASSQADAASQIALAETMLKIADGIESGELKYLKNISAMTQVRMLNSLLNQANYRFLRDKYPEYSDYSRHKDDPITSGIINYAEYPEVRINSGFIQGTKNDLSAHRGGKKIADKIHGEYINKDLAKEILDFANKNNIKTLPWFIESSYKEINSLDKIGIKTTQDLENAFSELIGLQSAKRKEDPIKAMERELIGTKIPGFFPTPKTVISRMLDEANIQEGMDILEPSAGKGDIADAIREQGVNPDTIEISETLRRFLDAKNHIIVSSDFMDFDNKKYDRIIMNPPFENLQDIDHVKHAYDLLKPNGRLVSIMGEGAFLRSDKKAQEFRDWLDNLNGISEQLPQGSFQGKEAFRQTGVNSRIVVIDKSSEKNFSITDKQKQKLKSVTKADIHKAFPGSQVTPYTIDIDGQEHDGFLVTISGGQMVAISPSQNYISIPNIEQVAEEYGISVPELKKKLASGDKKIRAAFSKAVADNTDLIELLATSDAGDLSHEKFHFLFSLLNKVDRGAIFKRYKTEEKAAEAFRVREGFTRGFWEKIQRILGRMRDFIFGDTFKPVFEGLQGRQAEGMAEGGKKKASYDPNAPDITDTKEFKDFFGDSKVVDENGKPLVVYHGTPEKGIESFSKEKAGTGPITGNPIAKHGFFFAPDSTYVETYAGENGSIIPAYLSLKKPFKFDMWKDGIKLADNNGIMVAEKVDPFIKNLKDKGYDGLIIQGRGMPLEYMVFEPTQIKSIFNRGTFDKTDKRIMYSLSSEEKSKLDAMFEKYGKGMNKLATEAEAQTKKPELKQLPKKEIPGDIYAENRKIAKSMGFFSGLKKELLRLKDEPLQVAEEYLTPISTRLGNINPLLRQHLKAYEFKKGRAFSDRMDIAEGLLNKIQKMTPDDQLDFDLARKNGDAKKLQDLIIKYRLGLEYGKLRKMLDTIREDAVNTGFEVGYKEHYHPRKIKDVKGFLAYMRGQESWSVIDEAIKEKEKTLNRYLEDHEKAAVANTLLRGYKSGSISLSKPGQLKEREIDVIWPELNQFYMSSDAALVQYLNEVTDIIEARKFFGKTKETGKSMPLFGLNYKTAENTVGDYVMKLLADGKIKPDQEQELRNIYNARFNEVGTSGWFSLYKNMSYIDTMGSMISAITQVGDLAWSLYKNGPITTATQTAKAIAGKSTITRQDIGINKIAEEFTDMSRSAKAVSKVFKWTGLEKLDAIGKEALINSEFVKVQQRANDPEKVEKLREDLKYFGDEADQLIKDLKQGNITENVKLHLFITLSNFQPMNLSEMPEKYLTGGNGRIFYMLKTFTLKQFDIFRREAFQKIAKPETRIEGIKNLAWLSACFVAANATADVLKALLLGRPIDPDDLIIDNLFRLFGWSKFATWKAREEGIGTAISRQILPPIKLVDALTKDIREVYKYYTSDEKDKKFKGLETTASIPIFGKFYYWWFGKGASKSDKKRKEMLVDDYFDAFGNKDKKGVKSAFKKIGEWNKIVDKEDRIVLSSYSQRRKKALEKRKD